MFGKDFLWGCATAAPQIEGAAFEDGKGLTVWDMFSKEGRCFQQHTCFTACDSYHRYKEDIKLLKELGVKVYRFSLSWARIMPNGYDGEVNPKGIEYYNNVINECLLAGITPYVTIFHWDLPLEIYKRGGWLNKNISDWFASYTKVIADNFSDRVKHFIPINEPECIGGGLGGTELDKKYSVKETLTVIHNILLCHGKACKVLKEYDGVKVGTAFAGDGSVPVSNSKEDVEAAYKHFFRVKYGESWSVSIFADPMIFGKYPDEYFEIHKKEELPDIDDGDMEIINQPLDFLGFNNYISWPVKADNNEKGYSQVNWDTNRMYTRGGIWPVVPEGLYWIMKFLDRRYHLPIIMTENGTPSYEMVTEDKKIHDGFRIEFLKQYISNLEKAKDEGTNVIGYFVWSLLDNFEWFSGYNERFGLVYTDFETYERIPKDSYYWFRDFIKNQK